MALRVPIQSTAGAVPMKNEKGEITMQKVKVARYVTGKRPGYAVESSSESEEEQEVTFQRGHVGGRSREELETRNDGREESDSDEDTRAHVRRRTNRRRVEEPEVLARASESEGEVSVEEEEEKEGEKGMARRLEGSEDEEEELSDEEIERRRTVLRQRARQKQVKQQEEVMAVEDEFRDESEGEEDSSEYEEYSASEEEEDVGPRLRPVFVRKKERVTVAERERAAQREIEKENEKKKIAEERRIDTLKMVKEDLEKSNVPENEEDVTKDACEGLDSGDDNDEAQYEAWKVRELKRLKRDREEREQLEKDKREAERLHNMTEEERREELKKNPRQVTNKASKGKYKFLQKYYHRGAFYLDEEETVLKRDFTEATLEDHFDKTILPKVMQVKNFGRSGRTKYTHLVDQDTTQHESPWVSDAAMNLKFQTSKAGGMKQQFERPSAKKTK